MPTREKTSRSSPDPSRRRSRAFGEDDTFREALGTGFADYYVTSRAWELKAWRETVTDWERDRYDRSV